MNKNREYNPSSRERAVLNLTDMLDDPAARFTVAGLTKGRLRRMEELGKRIADAEAKRGADRTDDEAESGDTVESASVAAQAMCDQVEMMCIGGDGLAARLMTLWNDDDDRLTMTELQGIQSFIMEELGLEAAEAPNS